MEHIGQWINKILVSWGIKPSIANILDEIVITLLLIFITIGLNFISQTILIKNLKKLHYTWHTCSFCLFIITFYLYQRKSITIHLSKSNSSLLHICISNGYQLFTFI